MWSAKGCGEIRAGGENAGWNFDNLQSNLRQYVSRRRNTIDCSIVMIWVEEKGDDDHVATLTIYHNIGILESVLLVSSIRGRTFFVINISSGSWE